MPALNAGGGNDFIGKPADYGTQVRDAYTAKHYHKPTDEVRPDWDLSGAVEDLKLYFAVGYRVAQADTWPRGSRAASSRPRRDKMLGK